ncbi:unnamed protein product [Brachionus calyciflorus]|uniref:Uncharacterized protein n=1 Tax=Brachionus calyciflorus TaxID=104777 RepID=A0A813TQL8_9BILA|nr:unnamed protein product [Brachionus calyciflorus]
MNEGASAFLFSSAHKIHTIKYLLPENDSDRDTNSEIGSVAGSIEGDDSIVDCFGEIEEEFDFEEDEKTLDNSSSVTSTLTDKGINNDATDEEDGDDEVIQIENKFSDINLNPPTTCVKSKMKFYENKSKDCVQYSGKIEEEIGRVLSKKKSIFM